MGTIEGFNRGIKYLRDQTNERTAIRQLEFFMAVVMAHPERIGMKEITKITGQAHSSTSRSAHYFGVDMVKEKGTFVDRGFGWVQTGPNPYYPKEHDVWLTKKGIQIVAGLRDAIEGGKYVP